ncbi:MAG: YdcF family protein [Parvularculaceae bacterium]
MKQLFSILLGAGLLWFGGFVLFVMDLPRPAEDAAPAADGVVVFTGGGGVRISGAMAIFADGAGERLLISGVHPDTSLARLSKFWTGSKERFDCCVDLGRTALTTEGNASELRDWALAHNYHHIILVTSDYHMPRALAVTQARFPEAEITPRAVYSGYVGENNFPTSPGAAVRLAGEYTKLIFARAKAFAASAGR